jgi:hypothetical protein
VADEPEEKPEGETPGEDATESSRETAVGHSVVEEPPAEEPASDAGATEVFFSREETAPEPTPSQATPPPPQPAAAPPSPPSGTSPAAADRQAAEAHGTFQDKPELFVAGAFVSAFVLGKLLKKVTGSDD